MAFTSEDKAELALLIAQAMDEERDRRRKKYLAEQKEQDAVHPALETKLYLMTTSPHSRVAFPDEKGRAVLHETFYARVTRKTSAPHASFALWDVEEMTAVAFGDGKLLDKPFRVVMNTLPFMTEIEPGFLETI